jgi:hypothetical protein
MFGDESVTYELTVSLPKGFLAVSPGTIVSEEETKTGYRTRFRSEAPGEGISLFIGPYEMKERMHGRLRLRTYFHPDVADLASRSTARPPEPASESSKASDFEGFLLLGRGDNSLRRLIA